MTRASPVCHVVRHYICCKEIIGVVTRGGGMFIYTWHISCGVTIELGIFICFPVSIIFKQK